MSGISDEIGAMKVAIEADVRKFHQEIDQLKLKMNKDAEKIGRSFGSKFKGALAAGAGVLSFAKILDFSIQAKNAARDFEEIRSKFNVVFGDIAKQTEQWSNDFGKSVGRSKSDVLEWMGTLQDTFVPLGFARDEAADFSKTLTKTAVDVASFNNAADDEVIRDFTSALVGNTETVRKYGVVITEANTKEEAYASGLAKRGQELSNAVKVQARMNLIMKGTTDAQGDAIRTSDSLANQEKRLRAEFEDTLVTIGNGLVPVFNDLIKAGAGWLKIAQSILGIQEKFNTSIEAQEEFFQGLINTTREYREEELKLLQTQLAQTVGEIERIQLTLMTRNNSAGGLLQKLFGDTDELKEKKKQLEMLSSSLKTQINLINNFDKELGKRKSKNDGSTDGLFNADDQKKAFEKMFGDLQFLGEGYANFRKAQINEEYQEILKLTGDTVNAERWKNEQLKQLADELYEYRKSLDSGGNFDNYVEAMTQRYDEYIENVKEMDEEAAEKAMENRNKRFTQMQEKEQANWDANISAAGELGNALQNAFGRATDSFVSKLIRALQVAIKIADAIERSQTAKGAAGPLGIISSILGFAGVFGHSGGDFIGVGGGNAMKLAGGGSFTVPAGYPNDRFGPLYVESGEKVSVTPANKVGMQDRALSAIASRMEVMNMQLINLQSGRQQSIKGDFDLHGDLKGTDISISNNRGTKILEKYG